jgi:hypothetical protein
MGDEMKKALLLVFLFAVSLFPGEGRAQARPGTAGQEEAMGVVTDMMAELSEMAGVLSDMMADPSVDKAAMAKVIREISGRLIEISKGVEKGDFTEEDMAALQHGMMVLEEMMTALER